MRGWRRLASWGGQSASHLGSLEHGIALLVDGFVEVVDAAVEPEEVVQLGHEVEGDGAVGRCQCPVLGGLARELCTYDWGRLFGFHAASGSSTATCGEA